MPTSTETPSAVVLIKNGRVYDQNGDVNMPAIADVLVVDGVIAAVRAGIAQALARNERIPELGGRQIDETIDATDRLVMNSGKVIDQQIDDLAAERSHLLSAEFEYAKSGIAQIPLR